MKIRAALIVDRLSMAEWQKFALEYTYDYIDIRLLLNCLNTNTKRRYAKHFAYYALNIVALRTATRTLSCDIPGADVITFKSGYNGAWQTIPSGVVERVRFANIKLVIKFGRNLLRIDDRLSDFDILSFHHGDPAQYRGRPAGFYELYGNHSRIGIIVQRLSNTLDGGAIFLAVTVRYIIILINEALKSSIPYLVFY